MQIRLQGIRKQFVGFLALDGVDLEINSAELIALLGPSGSGKTTLLRIIAGLEFADSGQVLFGNNDMAGSPVRDRKVGFVFQHYALFKHMNIRDNVGFGLRVRPRSNRPAAAEIKRRAEELLDLVQLGGLGDRYPHQLSGGQRQRVALARALAIEPRVLLLDEPFGALDAKVRKDLRRWLRELHQRIGTTTIFVTHDQEEALELADRVVIMNRGRIEQAGRVNEVYEAPASPFVFEFLGDANVLEAEHRDGELVVEGMDQPIPARDQQDGRLEFFVRPGDLRLADESSPGLVANVLSVHRAGPIVRAEAQLTSTGKALSIELPHLHHDTARLVAGTTLRLRVAGHAVFPQGSRGERARVVPSDAIGVAASRTRSRDPSISPSS
jgi:sulfate transport system ATP-binding protein